MIEKKPTKRIRKPTPALTEAQALDILASALNHCQQAGVKVSMGPVSRWYTISLLDVERVGDKLVAVQGIDLPEIVQAVV